MPLQSGQWTVNVNGILLPGGITINGVDPQGNVSATSPDINFVGGFWDEDAQKLTLLLRILTVPPDPFVPQIMVGYLFTDSVNLLGVSGTVFFTLAGSLHSFSSTNIPVGTATAKRPVVGWYAQIGVD